MKTSQRENYIKVTMKDGKSVNEITNLSVEDANDLVKEGQGSYKCLIETLASNVDLNDIQLVEFIELCN